MKILFVSKIGVELYQGTTNCTPFRIIAQSKIDDVFWLNVINAWRKNWSVDTLKYAFGEKYFNVRLPDIETLFARPDLVVFEGYYEYIKMELVKDLIAAKIPFVYIPQGQLSFKRRLPVAMEKALGHNWLFSPLSRNAAAIQYLNEPEHLDSQKWDYPYFVIPNGVEQQPYLKREFNPAALNAIYVGRMDISQKGLDLLIKACATIKDKLTARNFRLTLYGAVENVVASGRNTQALESMITDCELGDMIKICPAVFGDAKKSVFESADMFVLTSRREGMPIALLEALSYSLPCLVTVGTNMAEEIKSSGAGRVAKVEVESIAEELLAMVENFPATYESMGKNANALSKKYDWDEIAKQAHAKYAELLHVV